MQAKKRSKLNEDEITSLISKGTNRKYAIAICPKLKNQGITLACGLWRHARVVLSNISENEKFPLLNETNVENGIIGCFFLIQTGWDPRQNNNVSSLFIQFSNKTFRSIDRNLSWYSLYVLLNTLEVNESNSRMIFEKFGFLPWYHQPKGLDEFKNEIIDSNSLREDTMEEEDIYPIEDVDYVNLNGVLLLKNLHGENKEEHKKDFKPYNQQPNTTQTNLNNLFLF